MRSTTILLPPHAGGDIVTTRRGATASLVSTAVLAVTCVCAVQPSARAEDYCVTCSEPTATYRCRIEGPVSGGTGSHQFSCIKDIAQRAGHAACTVSQTMEGECAGTDWIVPQDAAAIDPADPRATGPEMPREQAPAPSRAATPGSAPAPAAATGNAPQHYVPPRASATRAAPDGQDAARSQPNIQTNGSDTNAESAVGEPASKAGNAISNAAKKTWDCVSSLFSKC